VSLLHEDSGNNRVPPSLTTFAPGNTARGASRVGTLETLCAIAVDDAYFTLWALVWAHMLCREGS